MNELNQTAPDLISALGEAVEFVRVWEGTWGRYDRHKVHTIDVPQFVAAWEEFTERLTDNYPFFHPRYAGQMLKPPHPVAVLGYVASMMINPNNHALDGGPPTAQMEKEVVCDIARAVRFPEQTLGHLTSSGTIANLEALWIARELAPGKRIAFSEDAHYTHGRMAQVLGIETAVIPSDSMGHMDIDALERVLKGGEIGVVVMTAGSTGLGAVDPIHEGVRLRDAYGFRLHVDAAYGGFFAILAEDKTSGVPVEPFLAMGSADSIAIDPHKHGLQPYGCGCVLFRDPSVGALYKHDSPYTYFTSDELHLGEISLECSRAGASAGALWLTLKCLPLKADTGLGPILRASLRAARNWQDWIERSDLLWLYTQPELDIVTYFPQTESRLMSDVDRASQLLFERAMADEKHPVFLSVLKVGADKLCDRSPVLTADVSEARILRSVLMKPEHETYASYLHEHVERHATRIGL